MSPSRSSKRPRAEGIEGSTVVIPTKEPSQAANTTAEGEEDSSSLIVMLAQSCKKHENQHNREDDIDSDCDDDHVPSSCAKALKTLKRIIPKVEKAYRAAANPKPVDVRHLCEFYLSVVQRSFCPAALHLFDKGSTPNETISRVMGLLEHIVSTTNRNLFKSQWRQTNKDGSIPFFDKICQTVASLLSILSGVHIQDGIFRDLINTLLDLSVLSDYRSSFNSGDLPVEIFIFSETLGKDSMDDAVATNLLLRFNSVEAMTLLKAALLKILHLWIDMKRLQELETFPHSKIGSKQCVSAVSGFAGFIQDRDSQEIVANILYVLNEALQTGSSKDFRSGLLQQGAIQVAHAILLDFTSSETPDIHFALELSTLVVRTSVDKLRKGEDTKLCDLLAECIDECIAMPPRFLGWSLTDSCGLVWRCVCPYLLDSIPLLPDVLSDSGRLLGYSIVACLRKIFVPLDCPCLPVSDYTRLIDSDILNALFRLTKERKMAEHAVSLCCQTIHHFQEALGLEPASVARRVIEECQETRENDLSNSANKQTKKRNRSSTFPTGNPTKRLRSESGQVKESRGDRRLLLENAIGNAIASAVVAADVTEQAALSQDINSVMDQLVLFSTAIRLTFLCQESNPSDLFQDFVKRIAGGLQELFVHVLAVNDDDAIRREAYLLANEISMAITTQTPFIGEWNTQDLLVWKHILAPRGIAGGEFGSSNSQFPFVPLDAGDIFQRARLHILCSRSNVGDFQIENELLQSTLDVLRDATFQSTSFFVRLLHWQAAAWMILSSPDIEQNLRRIGDTSDFGASKILKFLVSTPFSDANERVRSYTANEIGRLLMVNPRLKSFLLSHQKNDLDDRSKAQDENRLPNLNEGLDEIRIFKDIDSMLHRHCRIPQSQLSYTVGSSFTSESEDGKISIHSMLDFQRSGIRSLVSFFKASVGLANGNFATLIAKNVLLRVVRLWIFFAQNQVEEAASYTFGELSKVLSQFGIVRHEEFLLHSVPAIFRDILIPGSIFFSSTSTNGTNPFFDQLQNQCRILLAFLGIFLSPGELNLFTVHGGASIDGIEQAVNLYLPTVVAQLVIEKDYDVLRSLTAFSRYLIHCRRERNKGRKGCSKAQLRDLTVSNPSKSKLWARDLEVQTMELCIAPDISNRLLPLLLMHGGPDEDRFFTSQVLLNKLTLPEILQKTGQLVLKGLIMKFGEYDEIPKEAIWGLKRAAVARRLSQEDSSIRNNSTSTSDSNDEAVRSWVSERFMHLLVNVVQSRWREKSPAEKVRSLRCLRAMLGFLRVEGSSQFLPAVLTTVNAATIGDSGPFSIAENIEIRHLAVQILRSLVQLVWNDSQETIGENLTAIVVALIPLFSDADSVDGHYLANRKQQKATAVAVSLLKWLTEGDRGEKLGPFFQNIPFLPSTTLLDPIRSSLADIGLDIDDLRLTMTQSSSSRLSNQSEMGSHGSGIHSNDKGKIHLEKRLNTVCALLSNDNPSVRLNALLHLNSLLKSCRSLIHCLVDTEETTCASRFLTVTSDSFSGGNGAISNLVETLLSRCSLEADKELRLLVAKALGEVGAIAEGRLYGRGQKSSAGKEYNLSEAWILSHPPWKTQLVDYQALLLTNHLVAALKAAPTTLDHHKVAFTIQEFLCIMKQGNEGAHKNQARQSSLPDWLSEKLDDAGVLHIIEPFQNSEFRESETAIPPSPPFFSKSQSYSEWLLGWCRYMIYRSAADKKAGEWCRLLHGCRLACRTVAGIPIAEFLVPVMILERLCFGNQHDEQCIVTEILSALSYSRSEAHHMSHDGQQKAVGTLLSMLDTLSYWSETEIENHYAASRRKQKADFTEDSSPWSREECTMRIDDILDAIPLSLRAEAAAKSGMYARSLRLVEMACRKTVAQEVFDTKLSSDILVPTRSISSGCCPEESVLSLLKDNLTTLGEFETTKALSDENLHADPLSKALDSIRQREASKDWSGALQDYERAHHLCTDPVRKDQLNEGALRCMLELGQYESVIRQVRGSTPALQTSQTAALAPFAVEAAWRLGRWDTLSALVASEDESHSPSLGIRNFQHEVGKAMLAVNQKRTAVAIESISKARACLMDHLSAAAQESYARAYPHILKLQSLNELEESTGIIADESTKNDLSTYINGDGSWERRMELVDPTFLIDLAQSRLAIARLAGNVGMEASLYLAIGRRARKNRHYGLAANALAQAEASFSAIRNDLSFDSKRAMLLIQVAKLKHEIGETSMGLRLLSMDDIEGMADLDERELKEQALSRVCQIVKKTSGHDSKLGDKEAVELFRKSALLSTQWMIEGGVKDFSDVLNRFLTITRVAPEWEKGHFQYAKYAETLLQAQIVNQVRRLRNTFEGDGSDISFRDMCLGQDKACHKYLHLAVSNYVDALKLDLKHVFQCMPRLLQLWFEFSAISIDSNQYPPGVVQSMSQAISNLRNKQSSLTKLIKSKYKSIPARAFYSALPQLISRTMDSNKDLCSVVHDILSRVLATFPGQAMWPLAWLTLSKSRSRAAVGERIFKRAEALLEQSKYSQGKVKLLVAGKSLFVFLQNLARKDVEDGKRSFAIQPWRGEVSLSEFVPPVQAALSPTYAFLEREESRDAFPRHIPRMYEMNKSVGVMMSKARPKKLKVSAMVLPSNPRVTGSKARIVGEFHFLIKQEVKGDLRKDARVQDFNNVINRLLSSSTVHHRRMQLRTFTVTCISEDCGVLEWVPKTSSLRSLVGESYNPQASPMGSRRRGRRMSNAGDMVLRNSFEKKCQDLYFNEGDLKKAARLFEDLILKNNPPLLYWWFVQKFPDPHQWYQARTLFTLSAAVWSAVGYVIGLGDRHAENILVDTTRGELVHVDFDCIFNKALFLPRPEIVPFRLTANMIDAFGPVGTDGIYAASMKDAIGTLRQNRDTLLSVLEPFLTDPVIDWKRSRTQQKSQTDSEVQNKAVQSIQTIEERLQGIVTLKNPNKKKVKHGKVPSISEDTEGKTHSIPLSVDGQVDKLIAEATSSENLVQLYVGWMPWL